LAKRAKNNDAIMTGILVSRFKMGQIDIDDLEEMAADESRMERCSASEKGAGGGARLFRFSLPS
jgi:hypothetical protein